MIEVTATDRRGDSQSLVFTVFESGDLPEPAPVDHVHAAPGDAVNDDKQSHGNEPSDAGNQVEAPAVDEVSEHGAEGQQATEPQDGPDAGAPPETQLFDSPAHPGSDDAALFSSDPSPHDPGVVLDGEFDAPARSRHADRPLWDDEE